MSSVPPDDGYNAGRLEELVWALRWLAAEPEAAIHAFEDIVTADEIALDLNWWHEITRDRGLLDAATAKALREIDEQFTAIGDSSADLWTDQAIQYSAEWAGQRERARAVLAHLEVARADDKVGSRLGVPIAIPAWRRRRLQSRR